MFHILQFFDLHSPENESLAKKLIKIGQFSITSGLFYNSTEFQVSIFHSWRTTAILKRIHILQNHLRCPYFNQTLFEKGWCQFTRL